VLVVGWVVWKREERREKRERRRGERREEREEREVVRFFRCGLSHEDTHTNEDPPQNFYVVRDLVHTLLTIG